MKPTATLGEQLVAFNLDDEAAFERKGLSAFRLGYGRHAGAASQPANLR